MSIRVAFRLTSASDSLTKLLPVAEAEIMREFWARGPLSGRAVHTAIAARRNVAYTTILTTCMHLFEKGLLRREKVERSCRYVYTPTISEGEPIEVQALGNGFYRVIARFGFMETPDVPTALARAQERGLKLDENDTTFYLADLTLLANAQIGMPFWRDSLFIFLSRNARRATNFFNIPVDRVVEIGIQLEI